MSDNGGQADVPSAAALAGAGLEVATSRRNPVSGQAAVLGTAITAARNTAADGR